MDDLEHRIRNLSSEAPEYYDHADLTELLREQLAVSAGAPDSLGADSGVEGGSRSSQQTRNRVPVKITARLSEAPAQARGSTAHYVRSAPPPWLVGMTRDFYKDINCIDKKLQGRVLEAIADLSMNPLQVHGDTVKPLTGGHKDCWRYRVGDWRLVFMPNAAQASLTLLAFAPRGSVYQD
jgi:mRNA-degrading endonuclease RelE of RelBE toxin-antitoxin system